MHLVLETHWRNVHNWKDLRYDVTHFILVGCYLTLLFASTFMFIRFKYKSKFFILAFLCGILLRLFSFVLSPFIREGILVISNSFIFLVSTVPAFFLFSAYLVLLFLWGEIRHQRSADRSKKVMIIINAAMYIIIVTLYVCDLIVEDGRTSTDEASKTGSPSTIYQVLIQIFAATMYIIVSFGFFIYGYYTFRGDASTEESKLLRTDRKKLLRKVSRITLFAMGCFIVRAGLTLANIFERNIGLLWWLDLVYYFLLELVPLAFMLGSFLDSKGNKDKDYSQSRALLYS